MFNSKFLNRYDTKIMFYVRHKYHPRSINSDHPIMFTSMNEMYAAGVFLQKIDILCNETV